MVLNFCVCPSCILDALTDEVPDNVTIVFMALIVRLGVCIGMVMFDALPFILIFGVILIFGDAFPLILIFGEALVLTLDMLF